MENNGKRDGSHIVAAINILRKVTIATKVAPFVYAGIYIVFYALYIAVSDVFLLAIERFFYVSPLVIATFIYLSYQLKFCKWYRLQCLLPIFPQVLGIIDKYVYQFGEYSARALVVMTALIFVLSLVNIYFTFIKR